MSARVYERKFDWDEATRRYECGDPIKEIAADLNVTYTAVYRVVRSDVRERMRVTGAAWIMSGVCEECGKPGVSRNREHPRCEECATKARATSVGDGILQCMSCREWMPDDGFPMNRAGRVLRRGRHYNCRVCLTKQRQDYRERHKIPCVKCGGPRLPQSEKNGGARKHIIRDSGLCLACYQRSRRKVAA